MNRQRLLDVAAVALAVLAVAQVIRMLPGRAHANDFAHYYVTSRLFWTDQNPFRTDLAPEYARHGLEYEATVHTGTNPPAWLAVFGAVAWLPVTAAFWAWTALQAVALGALLWLTRQVVGDGLSARGWRWFVCGVVASAPVFWHFYFGQMQFLLAALVVSALLALRRGRGTAAVLLVTGAALLKLYPAILWPWFVWRAGKNHRERARLVLASAIFAVTVIGLTRPLWWLDVFTRGMPALAADALARSFNFNLPAFVATVAHLFGGLPVGVSWAVGTACGLAFVAWAYWRCGRGTGDVTAEFALLVVAMIVGSAKASGTYLVWLVFPIAWLATHVGPRVVWFTTLVLLLNCVTTVSGPWLDRHLAWKVAANYIPLYALLALGVWLARSRKA